MYLCKEVGLILFCYDLPTISVITLQSLKKNEWVHEMNLYSICCRLVCEFYSSDTNGTLNPLVWNLVISEIVRRYINDPSNSSYVEKYWGVTIRWMICKRPGEIVHNSGGLLAAVDCGKIMMMMENELLSWDHDSANIM